MADSPEPAARDWRDTVFLPKTDFPMKAGLAAKEPAILATWEADDLYGQLRAARAGAERFILHDGPPYANGDIHMGHAMNKVLKDIIVRSADPARQGCALRPRLGLPRPADRVEGRGSLPCEAS